jgi:hypothetical protein
MALLSLLPQLQLACPNVGLRAKFPICIAMRRQPTLQYSTLHIEPYKLTGRCPCQILRFWPAGLDWLELGWVVPQQFVSQLCSLLFVATCVGCYPRYGNLLPKAGKDSEDHRMYRRNYLTFRCLRGTTVCTV